MSDREDTYMTFSDEVGEVVREAGDGCSANIEIGSNLRRRAPD